MKQSLKVLLGLILICPANFFGIDMGSTKVSAAYLNSKGELVEVTDFEANKNIPHAFTKTSEGVVLFGADARNHAPNAFEWTLPLGVLATHNAELVKMLMSLYPHSCEHPAIKQNNNTELLVETEEMLAHVFNYLRRIHKSPTRRPFVSVPFYFGHSVSTALRTATKAAGFSLYGVVEENTALAVFAARKRADLASKGLTLLANFGHLATQLSVISFSANAVANLRSVKVEQLTGMHFNFAVNTLVLGKLVKHFATLIPDGDLLFASFIQQENAAGHRRSVFEYAQKVKELLSIVQESKLHLHLSLVFVRDFAAFLSVEGVLKTEFLENELEFQLHVTRREFEEQIGSALDSLQIAISAMQQDHHFEAVVVYGGTSLVPAVKVCLEKLFPDKLVSALDPKKSLVLATAWISAILGPVKEELKPSVKQALQASVHMEVLHDDTLVHKQTLWRAGDLIELVKDRPVPVKVFLPPKLDCMVRFVYESISSKEVEEFRVVAPEQNERVQQKELHLSVELDYFLLASLNAGLKISDSTNERVLRLAVQKGSDKDSQIVLDRIKKSLKDANNLFEKQLALSKERDSLDNLIFESLSALEDSESDLALVGSQTELQTAREKLNTVLKEFEANKFDAEKFSLQKISATILEVENDILGRLKNRIYETRQRENLFSKLQLLSETASSLLISSEKRWQADLAAAQRIAQVFLAPKNLFVCFSGPVLVNQSSVRKLSCSIRKRNKILFLGEKIKQLKLALNTLGKLGELLQEHKKDIYIKQQEHRELSSKQDCSYKTTALKSIKDGIEKGVVKKTKTLEEKLLKLELQERRTK